MKPLRLVLRRFGASKRGAAAVEFALLALPFFMLILGILQLSVYYMVQSSLDAGVIKVADSLRSSFASASPTMPNATTLKSQVTANSGGMIRNDSSLAVEIRQLTSLTSAVVPINGTVDYGSSTSTLVLRAQSSVVTFAPGFGSLANVRSSAIVRRQGS